MDGDSFGDVPRRTIRYTTEVKVWLRGVVVDWVPIGQVVDQSLVNLTIEIQISSLSPVHPDLCSEFSRTVWSYSLYIPTHSHLLCLSHVSPWSLTKTSSNRRSPGERVLRTYVKLKDARSIRKLLGRKWTQLYSSREDLLFLGTDL